jgi:predicted nucleic acid-binding Zn ribbon protein
VRRRAPRSISAVLPTLVDQLAPATLLARVQRAWPTAAGGAISAAARPVAEHDGVVTVSCEAAVWAQELELMEDALLERLNEALGETAVVALRCRTA